MRLYIANIFREDGEGSTPLFFTNWNERVQIGFDGAHFNGEAYHLKGFFAKYKHRVVIDEIDLNEDKRKVDSWVTY